MILTRAVRLCCDSLLSVAFPQRCLLCGVDVEKRDLGIACESCWNNAKLFDGSEALCWKCGLKSSGSYQASNQHRVSCHRCDGLSFTAARAGGVYAGVLRESLIKLKREPYIATRLLELVVETARRSPLDVCTRVLPVPLHPERQKTRGFNQASVIACAVAKSLALPIDEVSLARVGFSEKHRAGLDMKGRQDSVTGAFEVRHSSLVKAEDILLVDDVFTTGSTVSSCGEVLLAAGARNVFVLTVARAAY